MAGILFTPDNNADLVITPQKLCLPLRFCCYSKEGTDLRIELWTNLTSANLNDWKGISFSRMPGHSQHYQLELDISLTAPGDYEYTLRYSHSAAEVVEVQEQPQWQWYGAPGKNGKIRILPPALAPPEPSSPLHPTATSDAKGLPFHFYDFNSKIELQLVNTVEYNLHSSTLWHYCTRSLSSVTLCTTFSLGSIKYPSLHAYVALIRKGSTWLTPVAGIYDFQNRSPDEQWQCLLYQNLEHGYIHLWITVSSQASDCWLSPSGSHGLRLHCVSNGEEAHLLVLTCRLEDNWQHIFNLAISYHEQHIKKGAFASKITTPTHKEEKEEPPYLDALGFCTWNAFGKDVNLNKIRDALCSFEEHQISIGYLLIDDGWQTTSSTGHLLSFDTDNARFGDTLKNAIGTLKKEHPSIQYVGVWHTLTGYWNGVDESIARSLGSTWSPVQHRQNSSIVTGLLKDPHIFYKQFYKFLRSSGVDFVKVDNQGGFQDLQNASIPDMVHLWDMYRKAMTENGDLYLNGQLIHCMALTPHILFNLNSSKRKRCCFRNSDDFFPDEVDSHSWHIYANAINSLLTSQYHVSIIGDWDMFQSDHPFAGYHATSRAISGGPVYLTDLPGKHSTQLIHKLIAQTRQSTFTLLRSLQAPLPMFDTVFGHPMGRKSLLCLFNRNCETEQTEDDKEGSTTMSYIVCGFWNTGEREQLGTAELDGNIKNFLSTNNSYVAYVVWGPEQGELWFLQHHHQRMDGSQPPLKALSVLVEGNGSTLISLSPMRTMNNDLAVACLGLMDKFNGTKAILQTRLIKNRSKHRVKKAGYVCTYKATLSHRSSSCGFVIKALSIGERMIYYYPQQVRLDELVLNEKDREWTWDAEKHILKVDMTTVSLNESTTDAFCIAIDIYHRI